MKYHVLGPLRVVSGETEVSISAPKMESTLATLLLNANRLVSNWQLMTELWGDDPPKRATPAIHVYISQLRKLLGEFEGPPSPIVTKAPGYVLVADPDDIDSVVFERLVGDGRAHLDGGHLDEARVTFERALALWRGPVLNQLRGGPVVSGFVGWLEELRLECIEMHVETNLRLGRHRVAIGQLYGLVSEYPLHEGFYGQLMRALQASERRADALQVYRRAWEVLDCELGLEPGPTLRRLQRELLATGGRQRVELAG